MKKKICQCYVETQFLVAGGRTSALHMLLVIKISVTHVQSPLQKRSETLPQHNIHWQAHLMFHKTGLFL